MTLPVLVATCWWHSFVLFSTCEFFLIYSFLAYNPRGGILSRPNACSARGIHLIKAPTSLTQVTSTWNGIDHKTFNKTIPAASQKANLIKVGNVFEFLHRQLVQPTAVQEALRRWKTFYWNCKHTGLRRQLRHVKMIPPPRAPPEVVFNQAFPKTANDRCNQRRVYGSAWSDQTVDFQEARRWISSQVLVGFFSVARRTYLHTALEVEIRKVEWFKNTFLD